MSRSPLRLVLLAAAIGVLAVLVQLEILTVAFDKLGLSERSAYLLLLTTIAASMLNMPLFTIDSNSRGEVPVPAQLRAWPRARPVGIPGKTLIAVNVGGCVVPVAFCGYLFAVHPIAVLQAMTCVAVVAAVARLASRPIRGVGIGIPILVAPVAAAMIAYAVSTEDRAPLAYIGGTLGVLIGADILRLKDIRKLGAPIASIGGAGSFDGIFLAGMLAVLLA